jgi:uncharacterized protein (TIGR00725 family)
MREWTEQTMYIAVVGSAVCEPDVATIAEAVGREVAHRGHILVSGGRGGVMEAACRGAHAAGGLTVGILPGSERSAANAYVDVAIATGLGEARNALVVRTVDAVIAIHGEFGTLSEIGLALKMGKPVVGLGTWGLAAPGDRTEPIVRADTPSQAVDLAVALASA